MLSVNAGATSEEETMGFVDPLVYIELEKLAKTQLEELRTLLSARSEYEKESQEKLKEKLDEIDELLKD